MAVLGFQWSAARAAIRLARRDAWRNKGRSALIALMVALPVLAASTVSVIYRSEQHDPQDVVAISLGAQAQASIAFGDGRPTAQSIDGQSSGSVGDGSGAQPKPLTVQEFQSRTAAAISPRDRLVTDTQRWYTPSIRFNGSLLDGVVREFDYTQPGLGGLVEQYSGQAPNRTDQVVVSRTLARKKGIGIGDHLSADLPGRPAGRSLSVVGIVAGLPLIGQSMVIGLPGSLIPAQASPADTNAVDAISTALIVTGPDPVTWDQVVDLNQFGALVVSRSVLDDPPSPDRVPYSMDTEDYGSTPAGEVGIEVVVIGLVLLQIALLAGPAIAVGARRNQRMLAVMASTGAERKHLRFVVLATSAVIGLASCLVASLLGAGLGALLVVVLRRSFDQQIPRVDLHPLDLLGLTLVGGLTAVAAAMIPARQAARLDVVAALTGRRALTSARRRVPVAGLLVVGIGVGVAFYGSQIRRPFPTVAGLALTEIGLVAAAGAIVSLAARLAVRLPFAPRFALRDASRQRGRTAPAVAAVLAAMAGGTAALVYISAQGHHDQQNYSPASALGVVQVRKPDGDETFDFDRVQGVLRRTLPIDRVATLYGQPNPTGDGATVDLELHRAPQNECPMADQSTIFTEQQSEKLVRTDPRCRDAGTGGPGTVTLGIQTLFDDGSAVALATGTAVPADDAALRAGQMLVFNPRDLWPDGTVHISVQATSGGGQDDPSVRTVVLPAHLSTRSPRLTQPVFPQSAAAKLGVQVEPLGLLAGTTRMPTQAEEDAAAGAVRDSGAAYLSIERGYHNSYALGLLALVVAAAVVTLGGTFTAVGLAAAESRADIATLAAVGAGPAVRRRLAASQAGVIAGLGAVLGVASGVLAGWILVRLQQDWIGSVYTVPSPERWSLALPWGHLLLIGFGVPVLAVLVGFVSTRSRLPMVRRLGQ